MKSEWKVKLEKWVKIDVKSVQWGISEKWNNNKKVKSEWEVKIIIKEKWEKSERKVKREKLVESEKWMKSDCEVSVKWMWWWKVICEWRVIREKWLKSEWKVKSYKGN